jgi:hypothetical protein
MRAQKNALHLSRMIPSLSTPLLTQRYLVRTTFSSEKMGLISASFHFCTGFASRRHRRCFACLPTGKEEVSVVIHGGILKYINTRSPVLYIPYTNH